MKDRFKFRAWIKSEKRYGYLLNLFNCGANSKKYEVEEYDEQGDYYTVYSSDEVVLQQCTGLKDKNGLNRLFEYDIIDGEGIKIGNYYENKDLLKTTTNYLIKRMGTKEWRNSEQEAIKRGCFYAE